MIYFKISLLSLLLECYNSGHSIKPNINQHPLIYFSYKGLGPECGVICEGRGEIIDITEINRGEYICRKCMIEN